MTIKTKFIATTTICDGGQITTKVIGIRDSIEEINQLARKVEKQFYEAGWEISSQSRTRTNFYRSSAVAILELHMNKNF